MGLVGGRLPVRKWLCWQYSVESQVDMKYLLYMWICIMGFNAFIYLFTFLGT